MRFFNRAKQLKKEIEADGKSPFLVVGLGNPGKQYGGSRHNVGFDAVDYVAKELGVSIQKSKFQGLYEVATIKGQKVIFLKPQTYMNLSGTSVRQICDFYKIPPKNVIVLFDDISLAPGKVRIRTKGSHGGHNGIRNIIDYLQTDEFPRIKIGVGERPNPNYDLADWVLSRFTQKEREEVEGAIAKCPDIIELLVQGETTEAMNQYNGKL